jgi:hypothetical protein
VNNGKTETEDHNWLEKKPKTGLELAGKKEMQHFIKRSYKLFRETKTHDFPKPHDEPKANHHFKFVK